MKRKKVTTESAQTIEKKERKHRDTWTLVEGQRKKKTNRQI